MDIPASYPIRLGWGPISLRPDYEAERRRIDAEEARARLRIAELEMQRARIAEREAREAANRAHGVLR